MCRCRRAPPPLRRATPLPCPALPFRLRFSATRSRGARACPTQRHHYDGTTGARENDYVATAADKALAGERGRGGRTGGLGFSPAAAAAAAAAAGGATTSGELCWEPASAPCDMDDSRKKGDPPRSFNGIRVDFPFKTPMHPQEQVCVCVCVFCGGRTSIAQVANSQQPYAMVGR